VYNNHYKGYIGTEAIDATNTSYTANFSSRFTFNKGWSAEASGFYRGKGLESSVIYAQQMGVLSFGAGKQILKTKGNIRLNLRDPFYLMHFKGFVELNNFITNLNSYWDNRRVIITFTYRFGKI